MRWHVCYMGSISNCFMPTILLHRMSMLIYLYGINAEIVIVAPAGFLIFDKHVIHNLSA
jgi:hypothetical protein